MLIQEGQDSIDQMDINTQVLAESSRSGGRGRSVGPGIRRCGICGKTRHNTRTCQVVPEASGNEYSN
ncbi:hypothetical protein FOC1_g10000681 [Fusarium oxysporum f. sp. cubense race 1]|uniref:CCHC-type domain-containing protein n=1 Tax=Fusarium oxysporum f. sp. cubense (strain race 1) TaxID=1229664 RepID=N4UJA8_FUSC1|nr:hypothetical protein FOC1_g10000681 [Fusarium oxysporum f. sp. cubense race 1]